MKKFNIKWRPPEWMSFFYTNLHVFDHLAQLHVTQTSQPDFQKLSTDTFTASGWLLHHSTMLSHIAEWKKKPRKGWYICITHAYRHFSCCFAVKCIHPWIKSSFWKWDDNSVCHDLVCVSAHRNIMTGKTHRETVKIQGICTKHKCRTKYSTDYIIESCRHVWGRSFKSLHLYL